MAATNIEESVTHTRSVINRLKHTWVIDNFSHFYLENLDSESTDPEYPCVYSASFKCSQEKRFHFSMKLHPKGIDEENQDYVAVFLNVIFNQPAKIPIKLKFSILNGRNQIGYFVENTRIFRKTTDWGWIRFIQRKVLLDKKPKTTKGLLPDDKLTLLIELELYSEPVTQAIGDTFLEDLKFLSITKSGQLYGGLLETGDHSDIVLVVDGGELKAHKNILSVHSPVFKAMFEADMKEKAEGRVVIEDLTIDVARELLKFIYSGKAESLDTLAEELLPAADKYGLDLLKQICGQYLCGQVTTDNAARLLALADAHSEDKLKRTCVKYIRGHFAEVMLTENGPLVDKLVIEELRKEELLQEGQEE